MRRACLLILLAVALSAVALSLTGCLGTVHDTTLSEISKYTGLKFSKSSRLVGGVMEVWQEHHLQAKVEMNRADLAKFLASVPKPREESRKKRPYDPADKARGSWWDPNSSKRFLAITVDRDFDSFSILIGLDDPKRATVYLEWGDM